MSTIRSVFFISDSTGITAETIGSSIISQFPDVVFERHYLPFIKTNAQAEDLAAEFERITKRQGCKPLVLATMPDPEINAILSKASCFYYELIEHYVGKIGQDLNISPSRGQGLSHGLTDSQFYDTRIDNVNYALSHDDAMILKGLDEADVILLGVSRSGKTPTSLYLALHFGIKVANYPLTEDDFIKNDLPASLLEHQDRLVALTIDANRLHQIREKRRPGSHYSSISTCKKEVKKALEFYRRYDIKILDSTSRSIEELASDIIRSCELCDTKY